MSYSLQEPSSDDPQALAVLELMAALWMPMNRTALLGWLNLTGLRFSEGRAYTGRELGALLGRLSERGLVESTDGGRMFGVPDAMRHAVLERALNAQRLAPLVEKIRSAEPLRGRYGWAEESTPVVRELAWALHVGLADEQREHFSRQLQGSDKSVTERRLLQGFGAQPPLVRLSVLPNELVDLYCAARLGDALSTLSALSADQLDWADSQLERFSTRVRELLGFAHVLRGQPARALALAHGLDAAAQSGMRALVALSEGATAEARRLAREAFEHTRTKSSKRLRGLASRTAPFLVLVLLTDSDPSSRPYIEAQLAQPSMQHTGVLGILLALQALTRAQPQAASTLPLHQNSWEQVLFSALLARFQSEALSRVMVDQLLALAKQAGTAGYTWLERVFQALASPAMDHPLLRLYQQEAPWRRTLRALEAAADSSEGASEATQERLVWNFALAGDGHFELTARLQARIEGGWSSGRHLSLQRISESPNPSLITDHDRRVIQHIRAVREPGYYGKTTFQLDPVAARELVGHPRVFADGNYRTALEVIAGVSRVEARTTQDKLRLTLAPEGLLRQPVLCLREGSSRLVVYTLDPAQQRVAAVFRGAAIELPMEAQQAAQQSLTKLAGHFALSSEQPLCAPQIEEVTADSRLRVRLRRRGAGLALRLCVVPLEGGAALVPAAGEPRVIGHITSEAGAKVVCAVRDFAAEQQALTTLRRACPTLGDALGAEHEASMDGLDRCLELLCELQASEALVEWPDGQPLRLAPQRDVRHLRLALTSAADWLTADGELQVDEQTRLSLHELLARAEAARGRFIQLDDDHFVALTDELRRRLSALQALAIIEHGSVRVHPLWLGLTDAAEDYAELRCDDSTRELMSQVRSAQRLVPALPPGFSVELRQYQREGFEWLARLAHMRAGACLADDMGLGKTLQALLLLLQEAPHGPSLVIAPTSVCPNWWEEARRHAPTLQLHELKAGERAAALEALGPHAVLVVSYGLVQQESALLATKRFRVLVLDEAQAIKNASTQRARAVRELSADIRVALTGTPVENHLGELWSLMQFLNPGLLGTRKAFEERFIKPIERGGDLRATRSLKQLIRPFVLRRLKSQVLDELPDKTVITLRVEPNQAERALFTALSERALQKLEASAHARPGELRIELLAELTRLRRAACHPQLVAPEAAIESSKLAAFETVLNELRDGGHKVLVFSQFVDYLALVRARLDALGVRYQYLDGSCSTPERQRSVAAFQAGDGEVFLISLKAGGFGLNLTAADYVIHLDPWWNPAVEEQASDRAHRIGQTRPVTIYRLVMQDSIEEKILELHARKRELADRLLEGTSDATVSMNQLLGLLRQDAHPQ